VSLYRPNGIIGIVRRLHFFWLFLAACSGGPSPAAEKPLHDFRGIIHCHSLYSHDSKGTYEEILDAAKAARVDFICMTDHPPKGDHGLSLREGWKGLHDGVLFIQGAEYGDNILGLGLKEPISGKDRRGTIRAIHDQGGVAIACHPEGIADWSEFDEADGMEIYNVHATVMKHRNDPLFAAQVVKKLKEDPEHSFRLLQELDPAIVATWDEINAKRPFTGIAGNDAHQNVNFLGLQLDPYARAFKFVATHVLAEDLTEKSVLGALREGRCYVEFEQVATNPDPDSPRFQVDLVHPDDGIARMRVRVPLGNSGTWTQFFRNGVMIPGEKDQVSMHSCRLDQPGAYRVVVSQVRPLLLSNHVHVGARRP
jgi:hypothetical protein